MPPHPPLPTPIKPYFFYGHRRPSQNRPVVRGGLFSNRRTAKLPSSPAPSFLDPVADLRKWDPHEPSPPDPTPSPSEAFLSLARRLSPVARFILDSFRKNRKWGPPVLSDLHKLRRVDPNLVAEVLKAESDPTMASRFFHWAGKQKGYSHNFASYNAFTYCLNRANRFRSADQIPDLMGLQGKPPSEKQFEILIRMHADANRGLRLFYVYEKMKKFGIKPRIFLYNRIMDALVKTNHLDLALSVYDDFLQNELAEESVTYMILAKGLCKVGRIDKVLEILNKMRDHLCKPDVFAYTAMIRVLIAEGNLDGCLQVWSEMCRDGVQPDAMAYTTLVTALCKGNDIEKSLGFFKEMKEKGFLIDRAVYGALVDGLVGNGRVGPALDLLKDMTVAGYRADLSIYSSLMGGLCNVNKVDNAYKLLHIAVHEGLVPDIETVNPLLASYVELGRMDNFCKLLDQMGNLGLNVMEDLSKFFMFMIEKGDRMRKALEAFQVVKEKGYGSVSIYNILIWGFCKTGELNEALRLYDELKCSNYKPDSGTYSNVIPCLVETGDVNEACACYNKMKEMSWIPSVEAYRSLVKGLCGIGEFNAAIILVRDCLGNVTDGPTEFKYTLTILHACKSSTVEKVVDVLDEMMEQGVQPDDLIYSAIILGFCKYGTSDKAREVFSFMRKRNLLTEAKVIVYEELLIDHLKKTTAGLVLSGLKFFGLESKLKKLTSGSKSHS